MTELNKPIYLDNNASTPLHPRALVAINDVLQNHYGNPSSSTHKLGWYAQELVTIARERVAKLLNAEASEVIFTSGATEANNLVIKGLLAPRLHTNQSVHAITATTEHQAVLAPLLYLQSRGLRLTVLPVMPDGSVDIEQLRRAITPDTVLISLMAANNEIGTIHDIRQISKLAREHKTYFHCDATQAIGKIPIDVKDQQIDFLVCSGHKIYGPKGSGALYLRRDLRQQVEPLFHGGDQESRLRPGTLNVAAIVGFGVAAEELGNNYRNHTAHLKALSEQLLTNLEAAIGEVSLNGPHERLPGNLNFSIPGVSSASLITLLANKLIFSTAAACSSGDPSDSHVLLAIGASHERIQRAIRLGIGWFNTPDEITSATQLLIAAVKQLRS